MARYYNACLRGNKLIDIKRLTKSFIFFMFLLLVFGANPVVSDVLKRGDNEWVRGALKAASLKKWKTTERYAKRIKTPLMQKTLLRVKLTRSPKPQNFEELSSFLTNNPDWPEQKN